jgi:hypothetical protein
MKAAVLVLLALLVVVAPAVSQIPDNNLIVPGVRIGKWTLTMTIDDLLRMNGSYSHSEAHFYSGLETSLAARRDGWIYLWTALDLGAETYDKKKVEALSAGLGGFAPFKTDRGIVVRQSRHSDILEVYGKPTTTLKQASTGMFDLVHDKIGVAFRVLDPSGTIRAIIVFRPGTAKSIWKF